MVGQFSSDENNPHTTAEVIVYALAFPKHAENHLTFQFPIGYFIRAVSIKLYHFSQ